MPAENDDLRRQISRLLRRRPGWSLQATPTPGASPIWCFGSGSETDLSLTVDMRSICVYVVKTDQEVNLASADELVAWLRTHRAGALQDPTSGLVDKLKSRKLFRWE